MIREHRIYYIPLTTMRLLMDEFLHHLGALNYCSSWDFRDLRWCRISSIYDKRTPYLLYTFNMGTCFQCLKT